MEWLVNANEKRHETTVVSVQYLRRPAIHLRRLLRAIHSWRSATTGSTRMARRAGMYDASSATRASVTEPVM